MQPDAPDGVEKDGWLTMATRQADSVAGVVDVVLGTITEPRCSGDNLRKVLEVRPSLHSRDCLVATRMIVCPAAV